MKIAFTVVRVLLALIALRLLIAGATWAFAPAEYLEAYSISVGSVVGMNMIKTDFGAPLIGAAIFLAMFAWRRGHWFYPAVIIGGLYTAVRASSLAIDGYVPLAAFGVGVEVTVLVLLFVGRWLDGALSAEEQML